MPITEILKHGRENAIRAEILAAKLETTPRGLRRQIMLAREQGEIILYAPGGYGGYFLPSDAPEVAQRKWRRSTVFRPPGASMVSPLLPR